MKAALLALAAATTFGCTPSSTPETNPIHERTMIDLTHSFDEDTIYWPTETGFELTTRAQGWTDAGYYYEAHAFRAPEHGGTHLDAPVHFFEGRWSVEAIPTERLIGPGVLVDVSDSCAENRDYLVGVADFERWVERNGAFPKGAIVLLNTGFAQHWPDRVRYMGTDERGQEAVAKLHFPGLDPNAVDWLVERGIRAIGLDTPSIDHGPSKDFAAHVRLFEHNIPALENVASMEGLPARGFTVLALPMKIRNGSGGPVRIVALLDS